MMLRFCGSSGSGCGVRIAWDCTKTLVAPDAASSTVNQQLDRYSSVFVADLRMAQRRLQGSCKPYDEARPTKPCASLGVGASMLAFVKSQQNRWCRSLHRVFSGL